MHDLKKKRKLKSNVLLWLVLQPFQPYVIPWWLYLVHANQTYNTTQKKIKEIHKYSNSKHCIILLTVYISEVINHTQSVCGTPK